MPPRPAIGEEERRRREEEERKKRERELAMKKQKFRSAKDDEKVFETRGKSERVSYNDIVNAFVAKIEGIARTTFGLPFLKELVKRGSLNYEKALTFYLKETRAAIKLGLAKKTKCKTKKKGKEVDCIVFDFEYVLQQVLKSMGIKEPEYVDETRLKKRFIEIVKKASKNNLLERILLGEPFLEF